MLFVALLPSDTPAKNLTADPPPATGPYMIVKSEPGRGWSYARNPALGEEQRPAVIREVPDGNFDKIEISVVRNDATQVNEIERNKTTGCSRRCPSDLREVIVDKYEGHPVPGRAPDQHLLLLDEHDAGRPSTTSRCARRSTTRSTPTPWNGSTPARWPRPTRSCPRGCRATKTLDLYPHDMAKAKELLAEANPSDRDITVWSRQRKPQRRSGRLLPGRARRSSASTPS